MGRELSRYFRVWEDKEEGEVGLVGRPAGWAGRLRPRWAKGGGVVVPLLLLLQFLLFFSVFLLLIIYLG